MANPPIARSAGRVRRVDLDRFFEVSGVVHVDYHYAEGDRQELTRDLLSAAGVVIVIADDQERLDAAVREIRAVETAMYDNTDIVA